MNRRYTLTYKSDRIVVSFHRAFRFIGGFLKDFNMAINNGLFSSGSNEWATPKAFFEKLDAEFHFNLDPCSTHENAKCERHFTMEDDGLSRNWGGQECSATLHTEERLPHGSRSATRSPESQTRSWLCLFRPEQIRPISMTTYTTRPARCASSVGGFISTIQSREPHFRAWS